MKLGIFTDSHYSSHALTCGKRYNNRSLQKIRDACSAFQREGCDLVLSLGDLIDRENDHEKEILHLRQVAEVLHASGLPVLCLMGNHDAFAFTVDEFYRVLGGFRPTDRVLNGKHLLFLDACHFRNGAHYRPGDTDWTDTDYPDLAGLRARLSALQGDAYVFLHQNLDPTVPANHRLYHADEIRALLEECGRVRTVFQGHYHPGSHAVHGGIEYRTFPAMCENEGAYFTVEIG